MAETILKRDIVEDMSTSYVEYALDVLIGRAIPDVRDGCKPVHRRILYSMWDTGNVFKKPHKKSARTVGEVLGKYHPHGDSSVYDAMVRLAQPFSVRYPFVDGHGNFGSVDGDPPAAMRYTEARMSALAEVMMEDIEKNTVDMSKNYDETLDEPTVLPARLPALLLNGAEGIAVGFATKIPTHNLTEVMNGVIAYIDNPEITSEGLMKYIKAPDFPGGGVILGLSGIRSAYETGRGTIMVRSKYIVEPIKNTQREQFVFTEIPYQVNKSSLVKQLAEIVREKEIPDLREVRDESSAKGGMRIVVELEKGANKERVLKKLFKKTQLQDSFPYQSNVIVPLGNGKLGPKLCTLQDMVAYYVEHRKDVVRRKYQYILAKAEARKNVVEGLIRAINIVDDVVKAIRQSKTRQEAEEALLKKFEFNAEQAEAILALQLQRLVSLEINKYLDEKKTLESDIAAYNSILATDASILAEVRRDADEILTQHGDERRTEILADYAKEENDGSDEAKLADIEKEDVIVAITNTGYIKRVPLKEYASQKRGGKGVKASDNAELDIVTQIISTDTHKLLLCFGSDGRMYKIPIYDIPEANRTSRGKYMNGLLNAPSDVKIVSVEAVSFENKDNGCILMFTRNGGVKKINVETLATRMKSVTAITLKDDDELVNAVHADGTGQAFLATAGGKICCFEYSDINAHGRSASTNRGIKLSDGDYVSGAGLMKEDSMLLTVVNTGKGKLTEAKEYTIQHKGGMGSTNYKPSFGERVVSVISVDAEHDVLVIVSNGKIIRMPSSQIRLTGRVAKGVRLVNLDKKEEIIGVCTAVADDDDENKGEEAEQSVEVKDEKPAEKKDGEVVKAEPVGEKKEEAKPDGEAVNKETEKADDKEIEKQSGDAADGKPESDKEGRGEKEA